MVTIVRIAVAAGFLSAVADRFGLWGPPGSPLAAWGDFAHFIAYTAQLLFFVPRSLIPFFAWTATIAEVVLGVFLVTGIRPRETGIAAAVLLFLFGVAMTLALGVKKPLDYSVFAASGAALLTAFPRDRKDARNDSKGV